jgi:hypothetical protein
MHFACLSKKYCSMDDVQKLPRRTCGYTATVALKLATALVACFGTQNALKDHGKAATAANGAVKQTHATIAALKLRHSVASFGLRTPTNLVKRGATQ